MNISMQNKSFFITEQLMNKNTERKLLVMLKEKAE